MISQLFNPFIGVPVEFYSNFSPALKNFISKNPKVLNTMIKMKLEINCSSLTQSWLLHDCQYHILF